MITTTTVPYATDTELILAPDGDREAEQKKYEQTMRYFDFVAMLAHGMGIIMVCLNGMFGHYWACKVDVRRRAKRKSWLAEILTTKKYIKRKPFVFSCQLACLFFSSHFDTSNFNFQATSL